MSLTSHEIAEASHRILNPFTDAQLQLLGELCRLREGMRQLDLCCGKGEMLCAWAARFGLSGIGVDFSKVFLAAARERAVELRVADRLAFVEADATGYSIETAAFDIVSCVGATWIGPGLCKTIERMRPGLRDRESLMLVGEPYWIEEPSPQALAALANGDPEIFASLAGILDRIESAGMELVEMVLADGHGWDRYMAAQWMSVSDWLRQNPSDPKQGKMRDWIATNRRAYLTYGRRFMGWGVFVLRQP
jgi:SAM-dependent methyltransferase